MMHLGDWTSYWAKRTPSAIALSEPHRKLQRSYLELDRRANRLAHALSIACGVRPGDRVAVLAHNRTEHFEILFACAKLGALFAPLNWRLAPAELDAILADCEPRVLFYDSNCSAEKLTAPLPHRYALDESYEALLDAASDRPAGSAAVS